MKIVIANGGHEADYIIGMYKEDKNNELVVINSEESTCHFLSAKNDIPVYFGRPTKISDLQEAGVENADLFIALSQNDIDNYEACKMAKKLFHAKRCIATVINPKNVDTFKKLGIDSCISSTYLLAEQISSVSGIRDSISTVSLEDDRVALIEMTLEKQSEVAGKTLMDIDIADTCSIACILRDGNVIIPKGSTILFPGDRIMAVTTEENKQNIIAMFQRKK